MIHDAILEELRATRVLGEFIPPAYGRYSIAEIPNTIMRWLGAQTSRRTLPETIVERADHPTRSLCFLVHGFGLAQLARYADRFPLLRKLRDRADVYPLTSVFPITTPAAPTTIYTGLTPQEHGLPEWTVFFD